MMIIITTFYLVSSAISISPEPSLGGHKAFEFKLFKNLMCANYDPHATAESVTTRPLITSICDHTVNPDKCLDFLGNKPDADPAFAVKEDCKIVKKMLRLESTHVRRTGVPELKACFGTCATEFEKAIKTLDEVEAACNPKITKQATSLLGDVVTNLNTCDKAFEGTAEIKNKYAVMDLNDGVLEAIDKIAEVAKRFNE
ncbi:hypothetical protein LINGRAHAP2_LOCUS3252 [Linum grandiflorum]